MKAFRFVLPLALLLVLGSPLRSQEADPAPAPEPEEPAEAPVEEGAPPVAVEPDPKEDPAEDAKVEVEPAKPEEAPANGPAEEAEPEPSEPAPPTEEELAKARAVELTRELSNDSYRKREDAQAALWELGEVALEPLEKGAESDDPELAYRAKLLLRRIRTGITPDTPQEVVDLVTQYYRSDVKGKKKVFDDLYVLRAHAQILRLYRFESDDAARSACEGVVNNSIMPAVRAEVAAGRLEQAGDVLRLAPANDVNLRRRAALSRLRGHLEADLERTREQFVFGPDGKLGPDPKEAEAAAYHLALLRAKGDAKAARTLARRLGRTEVEAAMALFYGDPVPYMRAYADEARRLPALRLHAEVALLRWQGDHAAADKLAETLLEDARGDGEQQRAAQVALMLNGYMDQVWPIVRRSRPDIMYFHYDRVEQPLKALEVLGYPADPEEREKWLEGKYAALRADWQQDEARSDLLSVATLLQGRGEEEQARAIAKELAEIAEEAGIDEWREFVQYIVARGLTSYVELAFYLCGEQLGENDADGNLRVVINILFGDEGQLTPTAWRFWEEIDREGKLAASQKLQLLGAVFGRVFLAPDQLDPVLAALRERALELEGEERMESVRDLFLAAQMRDDAGAGLQLLQDAEEIGGLAIVMSGELTVGDLLPRYYSYASDWDQAAAGFARIVEANPGQSGYLPFLAGSLLRKGDREAARKVLRQVEMNALDEPAFLQQYAVFLEHHGAMEEAGEFWQRILMTSQPGDRTWHDGDYPALGGFAAHCKRVGDWKVAAACAEINALHFATVGQTYSSPVFFARMRFQSDMFRGLALHEAGDLEGGRVLLRSCFELMNGDASLADDYFPLLRQVGLTEEHDRNFAIVYERIAESIAAFPKAHNTYNSAAWIASRAARELDDALEKARAALRMRPRQAAYLDTMAEVWFARRDRGKAVEWSRKALTESYHGGHSMIEGGVELRDQYDRFRFDEHTGAMGIPAFALLLPVGAQLCVRERPVAVFVDLRETLLGAQVVSGQEFVDVHPTVCVGVGCAERGFGFRTLR